MRVSCVLVHIGELFNICVRAVFNLIKTIESKWIEGKSHSRIRIAVDQPNLMEINWQQRTNWITCIRSVLMPSCSLFGYILFFLSSTTTNWHQKCVCYHCHESSSDPIIYNIIQQNKCPKLLDTWIVSSVWSLIFFLWFCVNCRKMEFFDNENPMNLYINFY